MDGYVPDRSNSEFVERLRRDGDQALAAVLAEYRDQLKRMIEVRMDPRVRGRIDAVDVLQEVYLDASKRLATFVASPEAPVFVWLRGIAANTLTDLHRRHLGAQSRDAGKEVSIGLVGGTTASSWLAWQLIGSITSPSQVAVREETAEQLAAAIDQMDELDREVLVLRHFELLRNHEVAMILGVSENAASNRYVRALTRLREHLANIPGLISPADWKTPP
ncbi:MAG: sigma-70 family RNA polymerase sigma factor [Planctomycetota bacterium]